VGAILECQHQKYTADIRFVLASHLYDFYHASTFFVIDERNSSIHNITIAAEGPEVSGNVAMERRQKGEGPEAHSPSLPYKH
jgi:hypothetical protein